MTHREIIELLPWYVNATLKEGERRRVETHLAGCRECTLELAALKTMQAAEVELGGEAPAPSPSLLSRARAEIEDYERENEWARKRWLRRLSSFRDLSGGFWASWWRPTPTFARVVMAAQLILIVALGVTVFRLRERGPIQSTLTGPSGQGTGTRLSISFSEGVSEQEMRQTIQEIHGKIVAGPSVLGLYTIEVPVSPERAAEIEKLLKTLRQNRRVIRFAERQL